ncbi:MAG: 23S rRNA (adenine(2503)-C(2))-methyltransferase [Gammaproteobacteria bacterium 28-57-27]|nr:MAG: 23S rRNA (adenine(2503)-C(2))-methyltransferase [Gammaproteobacteria bacterium 28-57-27]
MEAPLNTVSSTKINLLGLPKRKLEQFFAELGEKPFRAAQVMKWIHQRGVVDFAEMSDLSKALREKLAQVAEIRIPEVELEQKSRDGTMKWVLRLDSGNSVEMVYIPEAEKINPDDEGDGYVDPRRAKYTDGLSRATLCVSSQVGCALACTFCSTGRQGFNRNMSAAEIVAQLFMAEHRLVEKSLPSDRKISNVVFMGMGEPLLNFEAVVDAAEIMMEDNAYGLSKRRVTVSTSGVVPAMARLQERVDVSLAVSLHAPTDALRDVLVPLNQKYPLKELMAACDAYAPNAPAAFITYEYVMLADVNDSDQHADDLIRLLRGRSAKVNLIPFNPFPASGYTRSSSARIDRFMRRLEAADITTVPRRTRGDDIDAACGQLVGEVEDRARRGERLERMNVGTSS